MVPGHLLPRLPEALGRWRAALSGEAIAPLNGPSDSMTGSAAALVQASGLIVQIARRLVAGSVAVRPRGGSQEHDAVPLSACYDWPGTMAWEVRAVDGLLGLAVQGPLDPPSSFFTAPVNPRAPLGDGDSIPQPIDRDRGVVCGRLARDWTACARGGTVPSGPADLPDMAGMALQRLVSLLAPPDDTACEPVAATLTFTTSNDGASDGVDVPLALDARALARLETGAWLADRPVDASRPAMAAPPIQIDARHASAAAGVSLRLAQRDTPRRSLRRPGYGGCDGRLVPRVLTDAGVPRANVAYATSDAVVCVAHHRSESFRVRADGSTALAHEWPRSIILELPFGDGGLVAWSNGAANWERPTAGYVMYRHGPDAPVVIDELPFRPGWGAWWRERLHWSCFKTGLGSWAPGTPPVLTLETVALLTVDAEDDGLSLVPAVRDDGGALQRARNTHALVLDPDGGPARTAPCGPWGPRTAHAIGSHGWRAEAFADSDVVRLASPEGGAVTLACYYPMKLAWVGPSLLVSTLEGELLLFEDVVSRLQSAGAIA
jgi:hypothetical protein